MIGHVGAGARLATSGLLVALVLAVASCDGATRTPDVGSPGRGTPLPTPTSTTTAAVGEGLPVETRPCEQATGEADPLVAGVPYPGDLLGPLQDDYTGRIPPIPINPDGQDLEIELPPAPPPAAYEPDDPRSISVFGDYVFPNSAGVVAEPNVAVHGDRVQMTWNWGGATSSDLGQSFTTHDPSSDPIFEDAPGQFCCDQLVLYVPSHDLWLWVLQYNYDADATNRVRLAVAHGDAGWDARTFTYWDFVPQRLGFDDRVWLDRTEMSISDEHVFLSINAFKEPLPNEKWAGSVVIRVPLDELAEGDTINPTCLLQPRYQAPTWERPFYFGSLYPVRGATDTMYLAAHLDSSWLAVWRWPDDSSSATLHWVADRNADGSYVQYPGRTRRNAQGEQYEIEYTCPYAATAQTDWCSRSDERVVAGWLANGQLGFAWNASQNAPRNAYPFLWMVVLDEAQLGDCSAGDCIVGYPVLGYQDRAVQYITVTPLPNGDLGGVVLEGGGSRRLTCTAIIHDGINEANSDNPDYWKSLYWDTQEVASSEIAPGWKSGDYLGVYPNGGSDQTWSAACMTRREGDYEGDPADEQPVKWATVNFVRFGRLANNPGR